jgi:hypothetical protein
MGQSSGLSRRAKMVVICGSSGVSPSHIFLIASLHRQMTRLARMEDLNEKSNEAWNDPPIQLNTF